VIERYCYSVGLANLLKLTGCLLVGITYNQSGYSACLLRSIGNRSRSKGNVPTMRCPAISVITAWTL
jgi:hypothetical protein